MYKPTEYKDKVKWQRCNRNIYEKYIHRVEKAERRKNSAFKDMRCLLDMKDSAYRRAKNKRKAAPRECM